MPDGKVILIAMVLAAGYFGGKKTYEETRDHVAKPVYHHTLKPVGCGIARVITGHKHCSK